MNVNHVSPSEPIFTIHIKLWILKKLNLNFRIIKVYK